METQKKIIRLMPVDKPDREDFKMAVKNFTV
nr:MAG TPA: hypothetical protein [Caudoviricetes sp.]